MSTLVLLLITDMKWSTRNKPLMNWKQIEVRTNSPSKRNVSVTHLMTLLQQETIP